MRVDGYYGCQLSLANSQFGEVSITPVFFSSAEAPSARGSGFDLSA